MERVKNTTDIDKRQDNCSSRLSACLMLSFFCMKLNTFESMDRFVKKHVLPFCSNNNTYRFVNGNNNQFPHWTDSGLVGGRARADRVIVACYHILSV